MKFHLISLILNETEPINDNDDEHDENDEDMMSEDDEDDEDSMSEVDETLNEDEPSPPPLKKMKNNPSKLLHLHLSHCVWLHHLLNQTDHFD